MRLLSGRNSTRARPHRRRSRTHASSCSTSMTRVLPVSGSSVTSQRSLLSADRAAATTSCRRRRPPASTSGYRVRRARPGALAASAAFRRRQPAPASSASETGGAKLPSAHTVLPVLRLRTASSRRSCVSPTFVRPGNVLGVAGLGHVVRHDRRASTPSARSATRMKTCVSSGDSIRSTADLPVLQLEGRQLVLLLLRPRPSSSPPSARDEVDQLLFFVADELLAVGQPRLGPLRRDVGQLRHERRRSPPSSGTMNRLPSRRR